MVQKARDARLLRALLALSPPRGVTRGTWRRFVQTQLAPPVRQVLRDLGQPFDGPAAEPEDLDERADDHHAAAAPARMTRPARNRRAVTIRETLARTIEKNVSPILGDTLDERVDALLARALVEAGMRVMR